VVIHPQSVIHSLVDYVDGSVLAQLGNPDMRTPIANALAWPERIDSGVAPLDLFAIARLDFEAPGRAALPLPAPGAAGGRGGQQRAGDAQCGQRSGGGGVSRRTSAYPEIASIIEEVLNLEPVVAWMIWTRCLPQTRKRVLAEQWLSRHGDKWAAARIGMRRK
jgi:1-deoxy-D-xylulose-5-phosphate reductoisomerase